MAKGLGDFLCMVGDKENGRCLFHLFDLVDQLKNRFPSKQVEPTGGFVKDKKIGFFHETAGDKNRLFFPLRESPVFSPD